MCHCTVKLYRCGGMLLLALVLSWHKYSRVPGSLPKRGGTSENPTAIELKCSAWRRLMQATLRDELRVALCRRGLPAREPKEDLIKRLMRGRRAQARTEEAAVALLLVRRRLGSRLGGLTLTGDAGAIEWIVETPGTRLDDLGRGVRETARVRGAACVSNLSQNCQVASLGAALLLNGVLRNSGCVVSKLTARFESW